MIAINFDVHYGKPTRPKTFPNVKVAKEWIMDGIYATDGEEQEHYVSILCQLEAGKKTLVYNNYRKAA